MFEHVLLLFLCFSTADHILLVSADSQALLTHTVRTMLISTVCGNSFLFSFVSRASFPLRSFFSNKEKKNDCDVILLVLVETPLFNRTKTCLRTLERWGDQSRLINSKPGVVEFPLFFAFTQQQQTLCTLRGGVQLGRGLPLAL